MNCTACKESIGTQFLKCDGICGNAFHITCLSATNTQYKAAIATYLTKIPNLLWFCDDCLAFQAGKNSQPLSPSTTELANRLTDVRLFLDNFLTTLVSSATTSTVTIGNAVTTQQSDGIIEISDDVFVSADPDQMEISPPKTKPSQQLHNSSSSSAASFASVSTNLDAMPRKRQRQLDTSLQSVSPQPKQPKVTANKSISLSEMIANQPSELPSRPEVKTHLVRSIYVSPFNPSIETADIKNYLKSIDDLKHIVQNIGCTKLMSDKRKNRRLSFVSFKLDVPRHHFDIISDPKIWQINGKNELTIKEFISKRETLARRIAKNPFRMPKVNSMQQKTKNSNGISIKGQRIQNLKIEPAPKFQPVQHRQRPTQCQKLCCSQPKPKCHRCHEFCAENLHGRRLKNRW